MIVICINNKFLCETNPFIGHIYLTYYAAKSAFSSHYIPYYDETEKSLYYLKLYNNQYNKILRKQKLDLINSNHD